MRRMLTMYLLPLPILSELPVLAPAVKPEKTSALALEPIDTKVSIAQSTLGATRVTAPLSVKAW